MQHRRGKREEEKAPVSKYQIQYGCVRWPSRRGVREPNHNLREIFNTTTYALPGYFFFFLLSKLLAVVCVCCHAIYYGRQTWTRLYDDLQHEVRRVNYTRSTWSIQDSHTIRRAGNTMSADVVRPTSFRFLCLDPHCASRKLFVAASASVTTVSADK